MSAKSSPSSPKTRMYVATWVYAGLLALRDGKLGHIWYDVEVDEPSDRYVVNVERAHVFTKRNISSAAAPGNIFRVSSTDKELSRIVTGGDDRPRFVMLLKDAEQVRTWTLQSQLDKTEHERTALLKKEGRDVLREMSLNDLQAKARTLMPERRRALIAYVISVLAS